MKIPKNYTGTSYWCYLTVQNICQARYSIKTIKINWPAKLSNIKLSNFCVPLFELYKFIISGDKGLPCKPTKQVEIMLVWFGFMVFNGTFNNVSGLLWRSVFLVEETTDPSQVTDYHHDHYGPRKKVRPQWSSSISILHHTSLRLIYYIYH